MAISVSAHGKHVRLLRRATAVGLLGLVALLLSACVEVNQRSTIKTDFTGTTEMRVGISTQALALAGGFANSIGTPSSRATPASSKDPFADLKQQITQLGGTSKDYKSDKFQGVDASFTFKSLEEMQTQINTVLGSNSSLGQTTGSTSASSSSSSNSDLLKITATATANGVRIDGKVDPLSSLSDTSSSTAIPGLDPKTFGGTDSIVQLAFTMPGKILNKDGLAKVDKSTVSWSFKTGDKAADIFVESDKSGSQGGSVSATTASKGGGGGSKTILIVVAIVAVVLLGGGGLFLAMRGRGAKRGTTPPGFTPQHPGQGGPPYGGQQPPQYGQPPYGQPLPPQYGAPPRGQQPRPPGYGQPPQGSPPQQPPYGGQYPPQGQPPQSSYGGGYGQPPPPPQGGYPPPGGQGQGYGGQYPPQPPPGSPGGQHQGDGQPWNDPRGPQPPR